jgi:CDP-6-deoxy-D-xylo-4-hexulose-3-dehydrase
LDDQEQHLRARIDELVSELYELRKDNERFVPGESHVPYAGRVYDAQEMRALVGSALDFWLTLGRYGEEFERKMAELLGVKYVIMANSGSSANLLAMSALTSPKLRRHLKPGDEVITMAASFPTTVNPIVQNGLVPVFVDVELETCNVDTAKLEGAVSDRTRAVFIAHTLGNPFDLDAVARFAEKHNLFLVEDACDALGSRYDGKMVGSFGDLATFSFYPAHQITTGEGGAVATNSGKLAWIARSFRDWGRDCWCEPGEDDACGKRFGYQLGSLPRGYDHKYIYTHIGYNLKPLDLQAAIGVQQLEKLPSFTERRKNNFRRLHQGLQRHSECLSLPSATPRSDPAWFGFLVAVKPDSAFTKGELVDFLETHKVATREVFAGNLTRHPAYQDVVYRVPGGLENTDYIMNHTFFIGVYPGLDDAKIDYVLGVFDEFIATRRAKI